jgi:hypothetical protein
LRLNAEPGWQWKAFCESGFVFLVAETRPAEALSGTLVKQTDLVKTCNEQPE